MDDFREELPECCRDGCDHNDDGLEEYRREQEDMSYQLASRDH